MSTAGVFSRAGSKEFSRGLRAPAAVDAATIQDEAFVDRETASLVHQLFSPVDAIERRRVFFASPEIDPALTGFCERIARVLAKMHGGSVALVRGTTVVQESMESQSCTMGGIERLGGKVWHVSPEAFQSEPGTRADEKVVSGFDYFLLDAPVNDGMAPVFARKSHGAVLVLTANRTRRQSALRAKAILLNWNVNLLGAVLVNRTFPVPESIYRRL